MIDDQACNFDFMGACVKAAEAALEALQTDDSPNQGSPPTSTTSQAIKVSSSVAMPTVQKSYLGSLKRSWRCQDLSQGKNSGRVCAFGNLGCCSARNEMRTLEKLFIKQLPGRLSCRLSNSFLLFPDSTFLFIVIVKKPLFACLIDYESFPQEISRTLLSQLLSQPTCFQTIDFLSVLG